jgi:hypothetical protein
MDTIRHCPSCNQWFAPLSRNQVRCDNCINGASRSVLVWFFAFAATTIAVLAWMLIK